MFKRLRVRGEGEFVAIVFFAGVGLAVYGGWALWKQTYRTPDDKCYWMAKSTTGLAYLLDAPPEGKCTTVAPWSTKAVKTGSTDELADFTNKAGRRICGQMAQECAPSQTVQVPAPESEDEKKRALEVCSRNASELLEAKLPEGDLLLRSRFLMEASCAQWRRLNPSWKSPQATGEIQTGKDGKRYRVFPDGTAEEVPQPKPNPEPDNRKDVDDSRPK